MFGIFDVSPPNLPNREGEEELDPAVANVAQLVDPATGGGRDVGMKRKADSVPAYVRNLKLLTIAPVNRRNLELTVLDADRVLRPVVIVGVLFEVTPYATERICWVWLFEGHDLQSWAERRAQGRAASPSLSRLVRRLLECAHLSSLLGEPLTGDSPCLIEVKNFETHVIRIEVHHRSFGFPILFAMKFDGFDVLDRESRREVGVPESPVGHEDAFAVWNPCAHVAPRPFGSEQ